MTKSPPTHDDWLRLLTPQNKSAIADSWAILHPTVTHHDLLSLPENRYLCQCASRYDDYQCGARATQEDMLCDRCRSTVICAIANGRTCSEM